LTQRQKIGDELTVALLVSSFLRNIVQGVYLPILILPPDEDNVGDISNPIDYEKEIVKAQNQVRLAEMSNNLIKIRHAYYSLGAALSLSADPKAAIAPLEKVLQMFLNSNETRAHSFVIYYLGLASQGAGELEKALVHLKDAYESASRNSEQYLPCLTALSIGHTYLLVGNAIEAKNWMDICIHHAYKHTDYNFEAGAYLSTSRLYEEFGEIEKAIDATKILEKFSRRMKSPYSLAFTLLTLGDLYISAGKFKKSVKCLERAHTIATNIEANAMIPLLLSMLGRANLQLGHIDRSKYEFMKALEIYQNTGNRVAEYHVYDTLGDVEMEKQDYQSSLNYFKQAIEVATKLGEAGMISQAWLSLGRCHAQFECPHDSEQAYLKALAVSKQDVESRTRLDCLRLLGDLYSRLGRFEDATSSYQEGLALSKARSDKTYEGDFLASIAGIYYSFSDYENAQDSLLKASELYRTVNDGKRIAGCLSRLATIHQEVGDHLNANKMLDSAIHYSNKTGDRYGECKALIYKANSVYKLAGYKEAVKCLERSIAMCESIGANVFRHEAIAILGLIHLEEGNIRPAIRLTKEVLKYAIRTGQADLAMKQSGNLGSIYAKTKRHEKALEYIRFAIRISEQMRQKFTSPSDRSRVTDFRSNLINIVISIEFDRGNENKAFLYSEFNRARTILDLVSGWKRRPNDRLMASVISVDLIERSDETQTGILSTDGLNKLRKLKSDFNISEIEGGPGIARPMNIDEIQSSLSEETALIEYHVLGDRVIIWLISRQAIYSTSVSIKSGTLINLVSGLLETTRLKGSTSSLDAQLFEYLIKPIIPNLECSNLIIVPHHILHSVPFEALFQVAGKDFADALRIHYLPSGSFITRLGTERAKQSPNLYAIGNPTLPAGAGISLPKAEREVEMVKGLFPKGKAISGKAISIEQFKRGASDADIIHLACHAVLNPEDSEISGVQFTPTDDSSGLMSISEISELVLQADLVTLSCCSTTIGKVSLGDEMGSISRAFLTAGAASVIASLWHVDDESTAYFMQQFYTHWKSNSKAEALRLARIATREIYPHPFHWAPFILIGDPR
jgi:CHAT domain-containing protein/tetratricopeptide (TPR) repeat protein